MQVDLHIEVELENTVKINKLRVIYSETVRGGRPQISVRPI